MSYYLKKLKQCPISPQFSSNRLLAFIGSFLFYVILSFASATSFATISTSQSSPSQGRLYRLAITQIVEHPSLNAIRKGVLDELADQGFIEHENLEVIYDSAQGSTLIAAQIAQRFISLSPDVIVAISTPSAQTAVNATKDAFIPVVFGAVTDPLSAKITKSLEKPSHNVTGTIDLPPTEAQLNFIKEIYPDLKVLGVLYNAGEANNMLQVARIKEAAKALRIDVIEATAAKTADVATAAKSLAAKTEALFLPNDNTVISAVESVLKATYQSNIPLFTSDPDSVKKGALAAIANDQYDVGRATGKIVACLLKGRAAEDIPIKVVEISKRYVNQKSAARLGVKVIGDINF